MHLSTCILTLSLFLSLRLPWPHVSFVHRIHIWVLCLRCATGRYFGLIMCRMVKCNANTVHGLFAVTGRGSSRHIAHVLSSAGRFGVALRSLRTRKRERVAGEGIWEFTLIPFCRLFRALSYKLGVYWCRFFFLFVRFWCFPFDNLFVGVFFFSSHFGFFFVIFPVFDAFDLRCVYAGALTVNKFFGYKSPAIFQLTIILTSNLLHSRSNSFVFVCCENWLDSSNKFILNVERMSIEILYLKHATRKALRISCLFFFCFGLVCCCCGFF